MVQATDDVYDRTKKLMKEAEELRKEARYTQQNVTMSLLLFIGQYVPLIIHRSLCLSYYSSVSMSLLLFIGQYVPLIIHWSLCPSYYSSVTMSLLLFIGHYVPLIIHRSLCPSYYSSVTMSLFSRAQEIKLPSSKSTYNIITVQAVSSNKCTCMVIHDYLYLIEVGT